ncbi:MAG TPA: hypothetical protein VN157_08780 [Caulobacter sp.]|nr:hypothetical protein [Caulobacter sp.]
MNTVRVSAVDDPSITWGDPAVGRYVRALAGLGPTGALDNARFDLAALQLRDRALSLVLPQGPQASWLTSPIVTYGRSLRDEVDRELHGAQAFLARQASYLAEGLLRATQADKIVYVNHLLFSTSLHGGWSGAEIDEALSVLRAAYPDRAIVWRSLNLGDHAPLLARMETAGGRRVLSRVVWRLAEPSKQWSPRTDVKADLRLAGAPALIVEPAPTPSPDELDRVLALYADIYLAKYSRTNPGYSRAFLQAAVASGVLRLQWVRAPSGLIIAFAGDQVCEHELASPLLGHDRTRPPAQGLYRIAMALSVRRALSEGLAVNYSAGAAAFKRNRGATPALEYLVVFDSHLPPWRRAGYALLAKVLDAMTTTLERIAAG